MARVAEHVGPDVLKDTIAVAVAEDGSPARGQRSAARRAAAAPGGRLERARASGAARGGRGRADRPSTGPAGGVRGLSAGVGAPRLAFRQGRGPVTTEPVRRAAGFDVPT